MFRRALRCAIWHAFGARLGPAARVFLGIAVTVAIWTLSRPAFAMPAPLCDDRGATSLAPPPTLQEPELAMRRAPAPLPCEDAGVSAGPTLAPGHGLHQVPSAQGDPVAMTFAAPLVSLAGEPLALPPPVAPSTEGVHYRIERPPRGCGARAAESRQIPSYLTARDRAAGDRARV